ncbi:response regulator transcription factor [Brucella oryzae]|uniref:response regulator transcription factor n=1 Tax=Brucella oryzae TaxID=335286 RepID=UPI001B83A0BE|nr:response regulator transcription factor [Brucella oryzae]MBR7652612.1 response regulator transcription factor [Brucella oryzae]
MRILLVEDTIDIAFAIASKLEKEGHIVTTVYDGEHGEDLAVNGCFDLVVLDINLPGRDGFAILRNMREQSSSCPVLVITARNQIADKIDLLELGADDYLVKPFDLRELVARIRAVARRHMGVAQPVLRIGELSINLTQRSVMQGDEPLDFGRREFDVLEMLATRFNVTVPKDMLVLKLFGHEDTGTPNAIELLVSRVRKKLENSTVEIVTQRGVGYLLRLKAPPL